MPTDTPIRSPLTPVGSGSRGGVAGIIGILVAAGTATVLNQYLPVDLENRQELIATVSTLAGGSATGAAITAGTWARNRLAKGISSAVRFKWIIKILAPILDKLG